MDRRPAENEYAPYYARYIALISEPDPMPALDAQVGLVSALAGSVGGSRELYRYAEGKWTIREVIGHLVDAERVFGYRAFCISRGERAPLPAFDENLYVERSHYGARAARDLADEFALVRKGNLAVLASLTDEEWLATGTASGKTISVRAIASIMAGHVRHHLSILAERYGVRGS